jgi:hypothetical protein
MEGKPVQQNQHKKIIATAWDLCNASYFDRASASEVKQR